MAEDTKNKHFKTAEQKHKENVVLKCKVCGKKMKGKTTLSRHVSHAHDEMKPVDREKMVIDAYYGKDVVDRTIRKVKNGEYKNKAVPIDIGRYLRLAGIKPEEEEKQKKHETPKFDAEPFEYEDKTDKLFVQVRDIRQKEAHDKKEDEDVYYVDDLQYSNKENELYLTLTKGKTSAMDYRLVLKFIEEKKISNSTLFVSFAGKMYPVETVYVKKPDEVAGNQIKCIVGYDSTKED